jgi:hypothetical protein
VLETLAVLDTTSPFGKPLLILKLSVKMAVLFADRVAIVQVIVPLVLPALGIVHENSGPEFCVSERKVVLPGTELVSETPCASSGPLLVTSTR